MKYLRVKFREKLAELRISEIAKETGFEKRVPRKVEPIDMVAGFFLMLTSGGSTLKDWAMQVSSIIGGTISKQMINNKLQIRQEAFAKKLVENALLLKIFQREDRDKESLFAEFRNVYIEDSTCVSLPGNLALEYTGAESSKGTCATARIQLCVELISESVKRLAIKAYREVDQKYSAQILSLLKAGDLVMRDRGYWCLSVFKQIMDQGAFFVSRYQYNAKCLDMNTEQPFDLLRYLKKMDRLGFTVIDEKILVGVAQKLPVRLIASKVSQSTYEARVRKAKKDRSVSTNHSSEYYQLLQWNILITNIQEDVWNHRQALRAYGFRWRIETIFKCWKSHFNVEKLFENKRAVSTSRFNITCWLFLLFTIFFFFRWSIEVAALILEKTHKKLSAQSFANLIGANFKQLILSNDLQEWADYFAYFATYEDRKDRIDFQCLILAKK